MTDFQVAMLVLGILVAILGFAVLARSRRGDGRPAAGLTDRQSTDAIGADLAQLKARMHETDKRVIEVEHHLAQVRTMMGALPTERQVSRIEVEIATVRGDLKLHAVQSVAMGKAIDRIEDWIVNKIERAAS